MRSAVRSWRRAARARPRSVTRSWPGPSSGDGALEWETDRAQFLGRGRSASRPAALASRRPLAGTVGNVLDPVLALRRTLALAPGEERRWTFVLAAGPTRASALAPLEVLATADAIDAARAGCQAAARERLERSGLGGEDAEAADLLSAALLYGDPRLRAPDDILRSAGDDVAVRGALGIGRATPVVVVRFDEPGAAGSWERLRHALGHWRHHGIDAALVAVGGTPAPVPGEPGVVVAGALEPAARSALEAGASIVAREATHALLRSPAPAEATPEQGRGPRVAPPRRRGPRREREALHFDNGYGGFTADGREYVVRVDPLRSGGHRLPPLPWVNVIANARFGSLVSESGAGFTWSGNSREHRLTPWSNDPLLDPHGEALYVEDLASGAAWSPLPGPLPHPGAYEVRHGLGASTFRLDADAIEHDTRITVDPRPRSSSCACGSRTATPSGASCRWWRSRGSSSGPASATAAASSPSTIRGAGRCWRGIPPRATGATRWRSRASSPGNAPRSPGPPIAPRSWARAALRPTRARSARRACSTAPRGRCTTPASRGG
jgi:cyclic beta-1,2-glucan synthetase